jgi:16S rRNA (uracil1498-N3)-methyltransferase
MNEMPDSPEKIWLAVGPEGGWSQDEYELAVRKGYEPAHTGRAILRSETAAIGSLAIFANRFIWQSG